MRPLLCASQIALSSLFIATVLGAAVTEPNDTTVPTVPTNGEEGLQAYFDRIGEPIDALAEAEANPGVFSPRCDFSVALVLSESQSPAGLAWYNVPADPTAAPAAFYTILPEGTPVNTVVNSSDIRTSPDYVQGGMVGFVLTKNFGGTTPVAVYYSEYQRNANCTACTTPGHWVMALAFAAKTEPNTYFLAFEDWEGANNSTWHGNDGDFNDKVFRITGVSCLGGGAPCDTGKPGLCGPGLTECEPGGTLGCRQQTLEAPEQCDAVDNDCNGLVDDGDMLCDQFTNCVRGRCVPKCGNEEFQCQTGLVCDDEGYCIEPACENVICEPGTVCRGGTCRAACEDVICPIGQDCELATGTCVDRCAGVECVGAVCDEGVCVASCACQGCADANERCAPSGLCVPMGCEAMECPAGQLCVSPGTCADPCMGAICPGGATCNGGVCDAPAGTGGDGGNGTGGVVIGTGGVVIGSGGAVLGNGGMSATSGTAGNSSAGDGGSGTIGESSGGCGCRAAGSATRSGAFALILLALLARRRRPSPGTRARPGRPLT